MTSERLLKKAEVCAMTSLSYPTIWRKVRAGQFPRPLQISANRVAWRFTDVAAWIENLAVAK